jgi:hypothetical protein
MVLFRYAALCLGLYLHCSLALARLKGSSPIRAADPSPFELYISTVGEDAWSGALPDPSPAGDDGPLATLSAAQARVRQRLQSTDLPPPSVS